ncbi:Apolipoprotein N-acyltransferase [uncultured Sphingopyxis sp.]|uniref:Apolipoprotein N-acyltransferase n=1 Tax=uncultured Sphingopyxis sp. TaxID=310581 RepID=A0A1Y5PW84_9SPHN|nr:apolipoprotein N-acyltransferase [uncultured Sphingopyxis sp.]SBV34268.1 Apolipoprotein N-acyltransferase [uncultured Sphingopyxis sp.]
MTALSLRIIAFADRWPKLLAVLLGAVSATGFAPLHLWPLTLLALAGWMALVARAARGRRAAGIGWAFGVGHFAIGLNWIATAFTYQAAMPAWLGWIAVVLLALYLAVYPALTAWGAWMVRRFGAPPTGLTLSFVLAFAALWTLTEWLRSWVFTGFAWNPLVATIGDFFGLLRLVGTYGGSATVLLAAGYVLWLAQPRPDRHERMRPYPSRRSQLLQQLGAGVVIACFLALAYLLPNGPISRSVTEADGIPITVVQPNIGQQDKWEGGKADTNFAKLARLTTPRDDRPRLILWPEAAVPDYLERGYPSVYYDRSPAEARARLTRLMNPDDVMLLGALKLELDKTGDVVGARNAVMTVHADGRLGPRYDKAHLVPYGEYLPMRPLLSALGLSRLAPGDIDFWPGPGARTLDLGAFGRAGLQICYEIIFSGQVVDRDHRPDFIFNPSNDAWFGSWGPPQHLAQARLRAIEEGLPVIRATPTGISAVIDADGRIVESLPMHAAGRIDALVPPARAPTLFARFGNILSVGFALLLLALTIAFRRSGR